MAFFFLELPAARNKRDGVHACLVEAIDAAHAKDVANAQVEGDGDWNDAVVTTLTAPMSADMAGWRYRIKISGGAGSGFPDAVDVEVTGQASDTVDLIGTALATALNATAPIAGAAYVGATNILTIAATGDNLGDRTVAIEVRPPGAAKPVLAANVYTALTHQGSAGAALSVTLTDPAVKATMVRRIGNKF